MQKTERTSSETAKNEQRKRLSYGKKKLEAIVENAREVDARN